MDEQQASDPTCALLNDRLAALLDDELSLPGRRELELHLKACSRCATELALERHARTVLRNVATLLEAPAPLRRRVRSVLAAVPERPPAWQRLPPFAGFAAAVVLVVAMGALRLASRETPSRQLLENVARAHELETLGPVPVSFASSDPAAVATWLRHQSGEEVDIPALDSDGYRLLGARLDPAVALHAVTLVYTGPGGVVTCAIAPSTPLSWLRIALGWVPPDAHVAETDETELAAWVTSDGTYVLAGNLQPAILLLLARAAGARGPE